MTDPVYDPTHAPVEDSVVVHDDEATDMTEPPDDEPIEYDEGEDDPENTEPGIEPETAELDLSHLRADPEGDS